MIELKNVSKVVRSGAEDLTILDNVSLEIPDGEFVAITGASGSGKSTLLGLIAGLDAPSSGGIYIDGDEVTKMSEDGLATLRSEKIGFVFQSFHLIPSLTAFENVLIPMEILGLREAKSRAAQLLVDVDLTNRGHHYPTELSGGEQQRIAIARAFANSPKILLADEPTGNLDSQTSIEVMSIFQELNDLGLTVMLVTHESDIAEHARRIVVFKDGLLLSDRMVQKRRIARLQLAASEATG
jgi:putative ABC transport system ATP-binding protein